MSHGWQEAFAQAARSTTEHDFKAAEFSHRLTTLCFIAAFCFVVYTYVIHMLQGFRTEDRLPFPCSTYMRHLIIPIASLTNHRLNKSYDKQSTQPRLQVYYRTQPMEGGRLHRTYPRSQRPAMQIDIPPHTGALVCASDMPPARVPPDTLGKDLPPLQHDSCVRMLTG
jgi:hypothetical protein